MSKREYYSVGGCTPVSREDMINWCDVNVLLDRGKKKTKEMLLSRRSFVWE